MPIFIAVDVPGVADHREIGGTAVIDLPPLTFNIALYNDGTWNCVKPIPTYWRHYLPHFPSGHWRKSIGSIWELYDQSGAEMAFELRGVNNGGGPVFYWPRQGNRGAILYDGQGRWRPGLQASQRMWVGIMAKGGGGAVVGYEGALAVVGCVDEPNRGALIRVGTTRAGVVAGGAAGVALVLCSGFNSPSQMQDFASDGADYALTFGAKWSSLAKATETSRLVSLLRAFDGGAHAVHEALKLGRDSTKLQAVVSESTGLAKTMVSTYGLLVDTDAKAVTALDIPLLGGGAELGVYYGWTSVSVLREW